MSIPDRRTTTHVLAIAVAALLLSACGNEGTPPATTAPDQVGQAQASPEDETAADSCIAGFAKDPCGLLTEELLRTALPDVPQGIEQDSRTGSFAACTYSWPSERTNTVKIGNNSMEVLVDNTVSLSWIKSYKSSPRKAFRRAYLPTAEELAKGKQMFAEEFAKKAKEEGLSEQQEQIGTALAESAIAQQPEARPLEGLGSMAAVAGNDVHVLDGNTSFQVAAEVSADTAADQQAAIAVARLLLDACD